MYAARENWYALILSILFNETPEESLTEMGIIYKWEDNGDD